MGRRRDNSFGTGVYFAPNDYVGLGPRIVILLVDSLVIVGAMFLLAFLWLLAYGEFSGTFVLIELSGVWLYAVVIKRSRLRTLGYRLTGCKIVNLKGERPSLISLTFRSLLWMFGPCNLVFDLIWCGVDDDRQTMRDRFAGTCLVRNEAVPVGAGAVHLTYFNALGYNISYPRVVHPLSDATQSGRENQPN